MNADQMLRQTDQTTQRRFNTYRKRSQERQGSVELTYDEFLNQLLDVWELHECNELASGASVPAETATGGAD